MDVTKVTEWLMGMGFMDLDKGKPRLTSLFQQAYKEIKKDLFSGPTITEPGTALAVVNKVAIVAPTSTAALSKYKYEDWIALYMQFITDAKIPRRIANSQGEYYYTSKYSEDGMKAFQKAMKAGAEYDLIVKSTMLAYKSGNRFKKAIGNYMAQGDWRSDYMELFNKAQEGETEVTNHIKDELKNGNYNPYTLG